MTSIHERVAAARSRLHSAGLSAKEAELGARLLAEHVLGWTRERFLTDAIGPEPDGFAMRYDALVGRRALREPLPYIVGAREFWGLAIEVTPDVLIPRHETEIIVETVLELYPDPAAPFSVVDVGTGSGCVAIAIATERPAATVVATDISGAALAVAARNAERHGVGGRVHFLPADLLHGIDGPFDLIVANPPYVLDNAKPALQPEVRNFEPSVALFGGADGLGIVSRLIAEASSRLRAGGHLVFEFGLGQDVEIEELCARYPTLTLGDLRRDLQGIARTAVARRV